jgi:hypothetical protein
VQPVQSDDRSKSAAYREKSNSRLDKKSKKVDQARHNLLQAETALAAEELP